MPLLHVATTLCPVKLEVIMAALIPQEYKDMDTGGRSCISKVKYKKVMNCIQYFFIAEDCARRCAE